MQIAIKANNPDQNETVPGKTENHTKRTRKSDAKTTGIPTAPNHELGDFSFLAANNAAPVHTKATPTSLAQADNPAMNKLAAAQLICWRGQT